MTKQLRLVDTPRAPRTGRRAVHWPAWKLDNRTRTVGKAGIAQARAALERAPRAEPRLRRAS